MACTKVRDLVLLEWQASLRELADDQRSGFGRTRTQGAARYSYSKRSMMEPTFDHERLDVYRLSIEYVAFSYRLAKGLTGIHRPARDKWLRAAQSIPLNIAEGNGKQSMKDKSRFFEIARESALECATIHDVLLVCDAIDDESNHHGKSELKRIVSMLTRLIQRSQSVAEDAFEYEYRGAEYEYEETQ